MSVTRASGVESGADWGVVQTRTAEACTHTAGKRWRASALQRRTPGLPECARCGCCAARLAACSASGRSSCGPTREAHSCWATRCATRGWPAGMWVSWWFILRWCVGKHCLVKHDKCVP